MYVVAAKCQKMAMDANMTELASVYPSSYINRNYLIKVNGLSPSGDKLNVLVGVSGAIALIGEELFYKFVSRAERDIQHDVTHCKLRRGIKFSFYRK